jgi:hypothetical protein
VDLVIVGIIAPVGIITAIVVFFWFGDLSKGSEEFGLDRSPVFQVGLEELEAVFPGLGQPGAFDEVEKLLASCLILMVGEIGEIFQFH